MKERSSNSTIFKQSMNCLKPGVLPRLVRGSSISRVTNTCSFHIKRRKLFVLKMKKRRRREKRRSKTKNLHSSNNKHYSNSSNNHHTTQQAPSKQDGTSTSQPYVKLPPAKVPDMDLVTVSLVLRKRTKPSNVLCWRNCARERNTTRDLSI